MNNPVMAQAMHNVEQREAQDAEFGTELEDAIGAAMTEVDQAAIEASGNVRPFSQFASSRPPRLRSAAELVSHRIDTFNKDIVAHEKRIATAQSSHATRSAELVAELEQHREQARLAEAAIMQTIAANNASAEIELNNLRRIIAGDRANLAALTAQPEKAAAQAPSKPRVRKPKA